VLTFIDPSFWLNFLFFFIGVFLSFFIPGYLLLKDLGITNAQKIILSLITGLVLWAWQGFIFGHLGIRWLSYVYLAITSLLYLKFIFYRKPKLSLLKFNWKEIDLWIVLLIITGVSVQLISVLFVGIRYWDGLYFCCSLPDSLYHLALTNQLIKYVPPIEPGASGIIVSNYHYWYNLLTADFLRIFKLPLVNTQYQYFIMLFSLLFGLSALVFAQIAGLAKSYQRWLMLFLYFSGDITFLLFFILGKGVNFSLPFLENGAWIWISPPRVVAAIIFFTGLSILHLWLKTKSLRLGILLALIFSSLIGFKIYVGIFVLSGFGFLSLYFLYQKRLNQFFISFLTIILGFFIYLSTNQDAGGLIFSGLWRFENFIVSPGLDLSSMELARQIYLAHFNIPRLLQSAIIYIALYFIFVFGTLIVGFIQSKNTLTLLKKEVNIFLLSGIVTSIIIGSFFVQKTGGANSSQFLITTEIILSIYTALFCFYWVQKIKAPLLYLLICLLIILTSARVMNLTYLSVKALSNRAGFFITNSELLALDYIRNETDEKSLILVNNVDKNHWRNAFSYYISFLGDRQIFVDGNGIAQDHGVPEEEKLKIENIIFNSQDAQQIRKALIKNNIDYLYMSSKDHLVSTESASLYNEVFRNDQITILQVRK